MVSPNLIKKIPIAIGIKPSQPTTFTNKTIDCGPGNGNVISNLPNTSLENNSLTINGVEIALGGTGIIDIIDATDVSSLTDVTLTNIQSGQVLKWDGTAWVNSSDLQGSGGGGGGNTVNRNSVSYQTTAAIASGAVEDIDVTVAAAYALMKVSTSHAAWVTFYTSDAARTSDATRTMQQDPAPGSGVLAEVITSSNNLTQTITPGVLGFNDDGTPSGNIYLKVANKSGSQQSDIVVTVTYVQLEG